jgi:hypothetical protein
LPLPPFLLSDDLPWGGICQSINEDKNKKIQVEVRKCKLSTYIYNQMSINSHLKAEIVRSLKSFLELDSLLTEADASLSSVSSTTTSSSSSSIPLSCPTNEKLFALLNRIQDGLGRLESAAEDSSTRGTLEPSLLSFLADSELNNPDAWLQQRLGEIIQDEKVALVRVAALQNISATLLNDVTKKEDASDDNKSDDKTTKEVNVSDDRTISTKTDDVVMANAVDNEDEEWIDS